MLPKHMMLHVPPDFYVYDSNLRLVYRGQLDDSRPGNDTLSDGADIQNAIECLLSGRRTQNFRNLV